MYLEWRRSWNSCRWPERAIFTTNGISDHLEATNYFIGNIAEHFDASTANSGSDTKKLIEFPGNADLRVNTALFTRPRPGMDTQVKY